MQDTLAIGVRNEKTYTVDETMCTGHTGTAVLSTPGMIGLMEITCLSAVAPHLGGAESTVGTHVCVSHLAASRVGDEVTVSCRLAEIDRRRLTFEVEARAGERLLGEGTHKRAVVDMSKFG